jgi:hypothetical protein
MRPIEPLQRWACFVPFKSSRTQACRDPAGQRARANSNAVQSAGPAAEAQRRQARAKQSMLEAGAQRSESFLLRFSFSHNDADVFNSKMNVVIMCSKLKASTRGHKKKNRVSTKVHQTRCLPGRGVAALPAPLHRVLYHSNKDRAVLVSLARTVALGARRAGGRRTPWWAAENGAPACSGESSAC